MPFVFKVKYESTLRRMIVKEAKDGTPDLSFKELEAKIYGMFQIPTNNRLVVTYMDQEKEMVTMGGDLDIHDACIVQRIDPLRMDIKLQKKSFPKVAEGAIFGVPYSTYNGIQYHKDVQCDGCTVEGPSFQSIRKELDHLCDDERYENPISSQRRHNRSMLHEGKMARYLSNQLTALGLKPPLSAKVIARKLPVQKHSSRFNFKKGNFHSFKNLDARLVKHLTIPDGTEVLVGNYFTKSWRIRNTGSLLWPSATQLVCVGGDAMGSQKPFTLKIPSLGLPSGEEIDASVDLVAPGRPGRFVSYWRLMVPTGQKFGHRIWVVIQTTSKPQGHQQLAEAGNSLFEQSHKKFPGLEEPSQMMQSVGNGIDPSCLPSHKVVRHGEEHKQLARSSGRDLESPAMMAIHLSDDGALSSLSTVDGRAPMPPPLIVNEDGHKTTGNPVLNLPHPMCAEAEHATDSSVIKSEVNAFPCVEKPDVNLAECRDLSVEPSSPLIKLQADPGLDKQVESLQAAEDHDFQEDIILGMLNSMGFTQKALNLELLRKNRNAMQETVDDLVVASEWDHILDDLEELGFHDADMNR